MYELTKFVIFSVTELSLINFEEVLETSADTVRTSVDGSLTFVKWTGENVPSSVETLTTVQGFYSYDEMIEILSGPEWVNNIEMS